MEANVSLITRCNICTCIINRIKLPMIVGDFIFYILFVNLLFKKGNLFKTTSRLVKT